MPALLCESMKARGEQLAVVGPSGGVTYAELLQRVADWQTGCVGTVPPGAVVAFDGDYGPGAISLLIALALNRNVLVPLSRDVVAHHEEFLAAAEAEYRVQAVEDCPVLTRMGAAASHGLYATLRARGNPGLILFSSGSTGRSKCALHDLSFLLRKFRVPRHAYRTIVFLQLDHIGGINTLLYTLANGGAAIAVSDRSPTAVCHAVEQNRAELLPTSPTFLNLLLLSEEHLRRDLSSLRLITYGTEPMPESTLKRVHEAFPGVQLLQTYGLSELDILRSKSRSSDSLWLRVGGEGYETRVADGRLWIRAESAMLGYLNAPSPFDADGFFDTGDLVDVDGEWIRFRGRRSDVINIGGNKVHPSEVESVLLELSNVADVVISGEASPITGQIVAALVRLVEPEPPAAFKARMRAHCACRLSRHEVPVRVRFTDEPLHSPRFKHRRLVS